MKSRLAIFVVPTSALLLFLVVERLPEADPNVEQSQAAAQSAEEAGRDKGTKPWKRKQKVIVSPLRGPREDHEQDTGDRANQHEEKDRRAVQPELHGALDGNGNHRLRIENPYDSFAWPGRRWAGRVWAGLDGQLGIGH